MTNMLTVLETKLLEIFRACSDDQREIILGIAQIIHDSPPFDPDRSAAAPASAPAPDPDSVQTPTRDDYMNTTLVRTAQKAVIPINYQMTSQDLYTLYDIIRSDGGHDPFNALCFAFDYGFVKGNRATRRGKVKSL